MFPLIKRGDELLSKMMMILIRVKHTILVQPLIKKGKRRAAQLWETRGPLVGAEFTVVNLALFISLIFPSSKVGGGPVMPSFLNIDRNLFGFTPSALYKRGNNPMKPSTAREMTVFASNCSSMTQFFSSSPFLSFPLYNPYRHTDGGTFKC